MVPGTLQQAVDNMTRVKPVQRLEWNGERYWVKFCAENKQNLLRLLATKLASFPRLRMLLVNSALSTEQRFNHECDMLERMHRKQLPVVEPILTTQDYLVTRDMGKTLRQLPESADSQVLLRRAFVALSAFHHHDMCHGRPALRDIVASDDGQVSFLDLEESQRDCSSQLMARDAFLLLMDSFRYEAMDADPRLVALSAWAERAPAPAIKELRRMATWLHHGRFIPHMILLFKNNTTSKQLLGCDQCLQRFFAEHTAR